MPSIALFQPDIPQNVGALLRLAACMDVAAHIIEPCGFIFDDKRIKRAGMDYIEQVKLTRHSSWDAFTAFRAAECPDARIILLSTKAELTYVNFAFQAEDILLLGRESAGVPQYVADYADASLRIPMHASARSLNVALAASMVLGEALRQTNCSPA